MKVFVKNILSLFPDYYKFDQKMYCEKFDRID